MENQEEGIEKGELESLHKIDYLCDLIPVLREMYDPALVGNSKFER